MKLIIIFGPSGSGKTTLSKKIIKNFKNGIVLNTDNYYKTGIKSLILSKLVSNYFDRKISFNRKLFKRDLEFICKNRFSNFSYKYNFKNKSIKKTYKKTKNIKYIIIEGIFVQDLLNSASCKNCILINLKTNKKSCMKRVIKRDFIERGKNNELAKKDFIKGWELFCKNNKNIKNSSDYLKKYKVRKKKDIKSLIKNINVT